MKNKLLSILSAILAGSFITLGTAPFDYWYLAILSPALLFYATFHQDTKSAAKIGFIFGISLFGTGVSWVFNSIYYHSDTHVIIAILLTATLVAYLSIFHAIQLAILNLNFKDANPFNYILAFSSSWIAADVIRGFLFTGFPWLYIGYTQLESPLISYAPLIGIYGLSFIVILISCFFAHSVLHKNVSSLLICITLIAPVYFLKNINWTTPINEKKVTLIQGNIAPDEKFLRTNDLERIWEIYGEPTLKQLSTSKESQLIIWPENALVRPWPFSKSFVTQLQKMLEPTNSIIMTGTPKLISREQGTFYNSFMKIKSDEVDFYHKRQLLIFGDYVPFQNLLRGVIDFFDLPMSSFIHGPTEQKLIKEHDSIISPLICYEIAYSTLVHYSLKEATVIVNISEDGWFGDSIGPHQHLSMSKMRAVESQKYVIRSTPSGITAVINHKGQITEQIPQFQRETLTAKFENRKGNTIITKLGNVPIIGLILFTNLLAVLLHRRKLT